MSGHEKLRVIPLTSKPQVGHVTMMSRLFQQHRKSILIYRQSTTMLNFFANHLLDKPVIRTMNADTRGQSLYWEFENETTVAAFAFLVIINSCMSKQTYVA